MDQHKHNYTFQNPNTVEKTAEFLWEIFMQANYQYLKEIMTSEEKGEEKSERRRHD